MKIEVITEHWFGEEVEGSDRNGGQCGDGDDRIEKEGDGDDETTGLNKSDLLSRFMGSIEDDKYLRDIVISFLNENKMRIFLLMNIEVAECVLYSLKLQC
ncbi:hypothetical protein Ahy_B01g056428 [Arachis hypogaea]|uniref:Uncharacterized protein n=1 Tax=Arachis hypogaea TaxID=3818 RepID=A0A445AYV8_ARAHY|nr:hypothetical protein Ahy_B01g056428 [Arachis hypogaea]